MPFLAGKFKYVAHHDDPPCAGRLNAYHCTVCGISPDTQSMRLYPYCPACDIPLTNNFACPTCKQVFNGPMDIKDLTND